MNGKTIMLQGTASGVGKSTLCIGLCRLFARQGLRVAPFKAQNLSNRGHILPDGREMARSQAIAAAACGVEPSTDMNPVLVKFCKNGGTFVDGILSPELSLEAKRSRALEAFRRLQASYEVVVAEGAGSPVELNLKQNDMVNMNFAVKAGCPVILVADIRRGGVFASVYGTISLFEPEERKLVKGIIVNDFYGDPNSFQEGCHIIARLTQVPVLGVVPHIDLHLEDEDDLPGENTQTRQSLEKLIPPGISFEAFQEQEFDRLADLLEDCLDFPAIKAILEGGVSP